ncbi:MAG TPA: single-stranded DNA-binding protein, partial [Geobacter sulfurreducens]|nr:single-stranded DNA-binding protein [Geobacter sulfurreducens]
RMQMLGGKGEGGGGRAGGRGGQESGFGGPSYDEPAFNPDDDIPF